MPPPEAAVPQLLAMQDMINQVIILGFLDEHSSLHYLEIPILCPISGLFDLLTLNFAAAGDFSERNAEAN